MRFTDRGIAALRPKNDRYEVWEDGRTGLGMRVGKSGKRSWVYMFRYGGKARRMTLGNYPRMTLADARVMHSNARKTLEKGEDPGVIQVAHNQAERSEKTITDLIEEYLERHAKHKRSGDEDKRMLRREVEPSWGKRLAKAITRRNVIELLDKIADRGTPVLRNRVLSVVQKMFAVGMDRAIIEMTPCVHIARLPEKPRERVLSTKEIKALWDGFDNPRLKMTPAASLVLKFLLATGQRRGEVAGARRDEFDDGIWEIPASRAKSNRTHRIPLSPLAQRLLAEIDEMRQAQAGDEEQPSPWLFPSTHSGRSITPSSVSRALHTNLENMGLHGITPHDFRRSASTIMAELGISQFIIGRILNHSDQTTTGRVYNKYEYMDEKQFALDTWAARIEKIISGESAEDKTIVLRT
ncbi:MAG: tyrosine-type recombinase/integrase, partial [Rhodospirillales bacterium]|nr:tyrosine-type recombinase/integrase [Rhodospirillales bacterium]